MYTEIKSFEDACTRLNIQPVLPEVSMLRPENAKAVIANYKLDIIQEAVNEGWKPNWADRSQWKYYPWFKRSSSGVGFSFSDYVGDHSGSDVGSRRVFSTREKAIYVGKQFIELYNDATWVE